MKSPKVVVFIMLLGAVILVTSVLKQNTIIKNQQAEILALKSDHLNTQLQLQQLDEAKRNLEAKFNGTLSHLKQITETKQQLESQLDEAVGMIRGIEEQKKALDKGMDNVIGQFQSGGSASSKKRQEGVGTLKGELKYLKKSLSKLTKTAPVIEVRNLDSGELITLPVSLKEAKYKIEKLPLGSYQVRVFVDSDTTNATNQPGDLRGRADVELTKKGKTVDLGISLQHLIHLNKPIDNSKVLTSSVIKYHSPITFAWDAVPQANRYEYQISRLQKGQKRNPPFLTKETKETSVELALEPNAQNEVYIFRVEAFNNNDSVGVFEINGEDFQVEDYFFSVE